MNKPIFIGIILFFCILATVLFLLKHRPVPAQQTATSQKALPVKPEEPVIRRRINVKLFVGDPNSDLLETEDRSIFYQEDLRAQIKEMLEELLKGPTGDHVPEIPPGTTLRDLFITKEGVVYADFSSELADKHPGGSMAEINTVYSIVNTVTFNFPQIKRVQILLNDQAVDSLKGHIDLSHPLSQDLSMVRSENTNDANLQTQTTPS